MFNVEVSRLVQVLLPRMGLTPPVSRFFPNSAPPTSALPCCMAAAEPFKTVARI